MSYQLTTSNQSKLIFIKTRSLPQENFLNGNTYFRVQLNNTISCSDNEYLLLSLYSASIPCSFYNITTNETKFLLDSTELSIPAGNYNVRTLIQAIHNALNPYTGTEISLTWDSITNKITITIGSVVGFSTLTLTNIAGSLGFTTGTSINLTAPSTHVAPNVVNIIDDYSLYLRTDLNLTNSVNELGNFTDILERIPIKSSNSVVYYESPPNQHRNLLTDKSINDFTIALTYDTSNDYVNLNGCDWELCLLVQTVKDLSRDLGIPDLRQTAVPIPVPIPANQS